jgi:hypothetical protein
MISPYIIIGVIMGLCLLYFWLNIAYTSLTGRFYTGKRQLWHHWRQHLAIPAAWAASAPAACRGIERLVVRTKGGASREKIRTHPRLERTRKNNQEWEAGNKAATEYTRPCSRKKNWPIITMQAL